MKIKAYATMEMKTITEYETDLIVGLGDDATEEDKKLIQDGATPMLNFITKDRRNLAIPIQFLISITN